MKHPALAAVALVMVVTASAFSQTSQPNVAPKSTNVIRFKDKIAGSPPNFYTKAEAKKLIAAAQKADDAIAKHLRENSRPDEIAAALYEGRILPGMTQYEVETLICDDSKEVALSSNTRTVRCQTRALTEATTNYCVVTYTDGRVSSVIKE